MNPYKKGKSERVDYGGVTFYRYPDAKQRAIRVYFNPLSRARTKGIEPLHREIYKDNFGPIPPGCHVHHKDGNPLNNAPENLECLTASAHAKEHVSGEHHARLRDAGRKRLREFQSKHVKWRKETPEGQAWQAKNNRKRTAASVAARGESVVKCEVCGATATRQNQADGSPSIYCSTKCIQTAFRLRAGIGSKPHEFTCEVCGKVGVTTRKKRRYCDRTCKSLGRKK